MSTASREAPLIAVIIPYYQREVGILRRAMSSIAKQKLTIRTHVIIIDDSSPVPVTHELTDIYLPDHISFEILKRTNGGPAAARNTGLNHVPATCRYVAFLDSDDEWTPEHLGHAWTALEAGYDFYFSDHLQPGQTVSAFARAKRIVPQDHPIIGSLEMLHAYKGDMIAQIITGNVIGTPTVVYRHSAASRLRFREEFRNAGEDYIFWIELSQITTRIAFSEACEVICGKGVNVFAGVTWGTVEHMSRIRNMLRYRLFCLQKMQLAEPLRLHVFNAIWELRKEYCLDLLHIIRTEHHLPWSDLREQMKLDPLTISALPASILSAKKNRNHSRSDA